MPDPSWDIEFSASVEKLRTEYTEELRRKVAVAGWRRRPYPNETANACDQQDVFQRFLRDLSSLGTKHRDPATLPAARDKNGVVIPEHFLFEDDPWTAYIRRNETRGVSIVALLFEEKDREKQLGSFSPATMP